MHVNFRGRRLLSLSRSAKAASLYGLPAVDVAGPAVAAVGLARVMNMVILVIAQLVALLLSVRWLTAWVLCVCICV